MIKQGNYKRSTNLLKSSVSYILVCWLLLATACNRPSSAPSEINAEDGKTYVSFRVINNSNDFSSLRSGEGTVTNDSTIVEGIEGLSELEHHVHNLWVLFFETDHGGADGSGKLRYLYEFNLTNASVGSPTVETATMEKGDLISIPTEDNGNIYETSTKLVAPGTYRMVIFANTKMDNKGIIAPNIPYQTKFTQRVVEALEWDYFDHLKSMGLKVGETTFHEFETELASNLFLTFDRNQTEGANQYPYFPMNQTELQKRGMGILCTYYNNEYTIPKGYSDIYNPYTAKPSIELLKAVAKLRVNISNQIKKTDDQGNEVFELAPSSFGYKLTELALETHDGFILFGENKSTSTGIARTGNLLKIEPVETGSRLEELMTHGFQENRFPMDILYERYLAPHALFSNPSLESQPEYLVMTFTSSSATPESYTYKIPIIGTGSEKYRPGYSAAPTLYNQNTILRNMIYEISIIFKGKYIETSTGVKVLPWLETVPNDDGQVDLVIDQD